MGLWLVLIDLGRGGCKLHIGARQEGSAGSSMGPVPDAHRKIAFQEELSIGSIYCTGNHMALEQGSGQP
jgi:hypothetical protein